MNRLEKFMESELDSIFAIGHASYLVRLSGKIILVDPIWNKNPYGDFWRFWPSQYNCDSILDKVDGVVISHWHADHYCPEILRRLNDKTPIHTMGQSEFTDRLIEDIPCLELRCGDFDIFDGVRVSYQHHPFNSVDSAVSLCNGKSTFYFGNDCFLDESGCKAIATRLRQANLSIDFAAIPTKFIHYYPFLLQGISDEGRSNETARLVKQCEDQAKMFLDIVKPKRWAPTGCDLYYAEGGLVHILNNHLFTEPFWVNQPHRLKAGDSFYKIEDDVYKVDIQPTLEFFPREIFEPIVSGDFEGSLTPIRNRLAKAAFKVPGLVIEVNNVFIDAEYLEATIGSPLRYSNNYKQKIHFEMDSKIFFKWINCEITFEEALGTRRFKYWRFPSVYDLKAVEFYSLFL